MPGLKQLITRLSLLSVKLMDSETYKICLIWCTLYALIYAFHFLTESRMPLNLDKHWGCGGFNPPLPLKSHIILLFIFLCGSFVIGTVGFKGINMKNLWNWATAWYIPASIALIFLLIELMGRNNIKQFKIKEVAIFLFRLVLIMSIRGTRNKLDYSYTMVNWNIYKDYFDDTIVPVFAYDARFGTLADGYTLWYTNNKPVDNYYYGAPYKFNVLETKNEEGQHINALNLEDTFLDKTISAIYMNNINNVGNCEVILVLYNEHGEEIAKLEPITPLSAKTMGFIMDNPITNVKCIKIQSKNGESVYVSNDVYIVSKGE